MRSNNVQIQIRPAKKLKGTESAFLSFNFDLRKLEIMKHDCPIKYWHKDTKEWEIPVVGSNIIVRKLDGKKVESIIQPTPNVNLDSVVIPFTFDFKTKPFNHQIDSFKYALNKCNFLLGDEQGLGKTKQAIDIAIARKQIANYKKCLIISCVNGAKYNWQNEIIKHSNETGHILGQRNELQTKYSIGGFKEKLNDLENLPNDYFLITNIETLWNPQLCNLISEKCLTGEISMVIVDEIHKCKNPLSKQAIGLLNLLPKARIALSGTPILNEAIDIFIPLKWLGYESMGFYEFRENYCIMGGYKNKEIIASKHTKVLREKLNKCMLRRLKSDVLDLPEKIYHDEFLDMNEKQRKLYIDTRNALRLKRQEIKGSASPLVELIRLRQITGNPELLASNIKNEKFIRMAEIVEESVSNNGKVIIFSNWRKVIEPAFDYLKQFNPALVTGIVKDTEEQRKKFMNDDTCKVILGTTPLLGTAFNLNAHNVDTVIFLDSPWNEPTKEQAIDRSHRIGTNRNINIYTLICKNTIDEKIENIVYKKDIIAKRILNKSELIDYLLE